MMMMMTRDINPRWT